MYKFIFLKFYYLLIIKKVNKLGKGATFQLKPKLKLSNSFSFVFLLQRHKGFSEFCGVYLTMLSFQNASLKAVLGLYGLVLTQHLGLCLQYLYC